MLTSTVIVGSHNNAVRAQKCLSNAKLRCDIIKTNSDNSRGCIYALRIGTEYLKAALNILDANNIKYEY